MAVKAGHREASAGAGGGKVTTAVLRDGPF